jgi:hypothetical protein
LTAPAGANSEVFIRNHDRRPTNDHSRAHHLAISAVRPRHGCATLVNVNDVRGRAAALALLDDAIAAT